MKELKALIINSLSCFPVPGFLNFRRDKKPPYLFYVCCFFLFSIIGFAQTEEKKSTKIETKYNEGDYKAAYSLNKSLLKKIKNNSDTSGSAYCRALLNQAIITEALNRYDEMSANLVLAKKQLYKLANSNSAEYLKRLKHLADFYYYNADYVAADSVCRLALLELTSVDSSAGSLKYSLKFLLSKICLKSGYYNETLSLETDLLNTASKKAKQTTATITTAEGVKKSVKLSKRDLKNARFEYAKTLNHRTDILYNKGNYKELEPELSKNETWLRLNIGRRNLYYRDHLFIKSKYAETRKTLSEALNYYRQANHYTRYKPAEKTGLAVQEKLVLLNHLAKRKPEAVKYNKKLEKSVKRYFGNKSPFIQRYNFLEVNTLYLDYKYNRAEKKINNIFASGNSIKNNKILRLSLLDMKVNLLLKSCRFDEAEDSLKVILVLKKKMYGENSPEYHTELLRLADFYSNFTSKFTQAKDIQENSFLKIVAPQLSVQHTNYTRYMEQLAGTYDNMEKYEMAIKYLEEASRNLKDYYGKDHIEYAVSLEKLSSVLIKKGVYGNAEELIRQAVSIFKNVSGQGYELNKSSAYLAMARLFTLLGSYDEAEDALRKAGKYSKRARKSESLSSVKSADELAALYLKQARYNEAERLLQSNIEKKQKQLGAFNRELILSLNLLGSLYLITGDYAAAEKSIQRSLSLTEKNFTDSSVRYTESLRLLENLYHELGDYKKSEEISNRILNIQRKQLGNNHIEVAASLTKLALIQLHNNPRAKGPEQMLLEALAITRFNLGTQHPQYAEQMKELALIYIHDENYSKADSLLDNALSVWKAKHDKADLFTAELTVLKGNIYYKKGSYAYAQLKYTEAKKIYKAAFNANHPGYVKVSGKLARAYYMNKEYNKALAELNETTGKYLDFIKKFFPSLSFSEKTKYWNSIRDDFEFYNTLATKKEVLKPEVVARIYNNLIATKALLLGSSIKVKERILNSKDENLIAKFNQWTEKKQYLLQVAGMAKEQQAEANINPAKLEREINQLEKELSEGSELFSKNFDNQNITWKNIKKSLKQNEYAVEILRFRYFDKSFTDSVIYAALIVSGKSDKGPQPVIFDNGKNMESKFIRYYRNVITTRSDEDELSYNVFWQPLKQYIADGAKVYLSNEGVYNELNIESVKAPDGSYTIDKNTIAVVSNTKDIIVRDIKKAVAAQKAVFFGNPTFYVSANAENTIPQLPGTEAEVKQSEIVFLNNKWQTKKYILNSADEDSLKMVNNPKVLHIATHGYFRQDNNNIESSEDDIQKEFSENPLLKSGVLLKGAGEVLKTDNILKINNEKGILTAYEAMDMNLDNTDLVVLSACETGRGQVNIGEGVFGLQRAFLVAGANTLIMTLFKVDDEVTKELMTNFYTLWLQTGDKRQAFTAAKKDIKAKYHLPIYWGAFVMIGAGD